jgi:hypothetical protein
MLTAPIGHVRDLNGYVGRRRQDLVQEDCRILGAVFRVQCPKMHNDGHSACIGRGKCAGPWRQVRHS